MNKSQSITIRQTVNQLQGATAARVALKAFSDHLGAIRSSTGPNEVAKEILDLLKIIEVKIEAREAQIQKLQGILHDATEPE